MTSTENAIGQDLIAAVGAAAAAKEAARRRQAPTVGEFMVGSPSKAAAPFLLGLDGEHAAWRGREAPAQEVSSLDAHIERLAGAPAENARMSGAAAFMWGAHPIAASKRAALMRVRLEADHAAWRARQDGQNEITSRTG